VREATAAAAVGRSEVWMQESQARSALYCWCRDDRTRGQAAQ
jgi:hypothetical protein